MQNTGRHQKNLIGHITNKTQVRSSLPGLDLGGGNRVQLVPGMTVTIEVKTGKRRVIDYFLSPVMQYGNEGIRER